LFCFVFVFFLLQFFFFVLHAGNWASARHCKNMEMKANTCCELQKNDQR
jgi:hypothetical protein